MGAAACAHSSARARPLTLAPRHPRPAARPARLASGISDSCVRRLACACPSARACPLTPRPSSPARPRRPASQATPDHTPKGRGYQKSLTYLDGANDYWTSQTGDFCDPALYVDLYSSDAPAYGQNNSLLCSQTSQQGCAYEDELFVNFTLGVIAEHDPATPLFYYLALHNTHEPLEAPDADLARFQFVYDNCTTALPGWDASKTNTCSKAVAAPDAYGAADKGCCFRWYYTTMAHIADKHIGTVVSALQAKGMWDNTLLLLSSDNGGPIYRNGAAGGNNFPLRGGKKSNFEGGVRVNAFVSGGLVPAAVRGTTTEALMGSEDWYATFCGLAGIDATDAKAAAAGLPPVEGYDLWPLLSGANMTGPRTEVWLGSGGTGDSDNSKQPIIQGLIRADGYKVLWGDVIENAWTGPFYPNSTTNWCDTCPLSCGTIDAPTCLFNVFSDPTEHDEVSRANPAIVKDMAKRLKEISATIFAPDRGDPDTVDACKAGADGYVRPFLP